jgi:hypothetical protein
MLARQDAGTQPSADGAGGEGISFGETDHPDEGLVFFLSFVHFKLPELFLFLSLRYKTAADPQEGFFG